jgi:hypothetical protein
MNKTIVSSVPPWKAGSHHRDDLRRGARLKIGQREAQQPEIQLVAEAAQHALAELALERVDEVLEPAVDQHDREKREAQHHQVGYALELKPEHRLRELRALGDRVIDDRLRQVQRRVKKRKRGERKNQQRQLRLPAMPDDEPVDRRVEIGRQRLRLRLRRLARACTAEQSASRSRGGRLFDRRDGGHTLHRALVIAMGSGQTSDRAG